MGVRIEAQAEPIAGYRLIERLGGGGFGEVWKAEAPGGLFKAIKFVYGDLEASDEDASRAGQELKALSRVKTVHHPYILSLERYDIIDGQLIIVMELADRTLWDRFRECRNQGLPGIPREELLGYLQETAEALDLMNSQFQLQHLDIKPQNLFLVFNHIKVADFGLVKDLEGRAATVTGGVTPVYAAPETFDGWVSRFSDQYSLAIVYQELLNGQRPFSGTTIRQLVLQHLQGTPDLSSLLSTERRVIARALSKDPDHRFPTCLDFVQTLRRAVAGSGLHKVPTPVPVPPPPASVPREEALETPAEDLQATQNARGPAFKKKESAPAPPLEEQVHLTPLPPRPYKKREKKSAAQHSNGTAAAPPLVEMPADEPEPRSSKPPVPVVAGDGVLRPALVIGLGRLGSNVLQLLRRELTERFRDPDLLPCLRLLYLDTDESAINQALRTTGLRPGEVILSRLHRASHYLKPRDGKLPYSDWLNPKLLYSIPRQRSQAGLRALGRLAFVDNYRSICQRLEAALAACTASATLQEAVANTRLGQRTTVPRIYLVTSLAGCTGGGMFVDVAYLVRRLLRDQGFENGEIVGIFLAPEAGAERVAAADLANTFAALTELNHFASPEAVFTARYDVRDGTAPGKLFQENGPPFHHGVLLSIQQSKSAAAANRQPEAVQHASHYLFQDLLTPLGRTLDEARQQLACEHPGPFYQALPFHTFGLRRICWPHRQVLRRAAFGLCTRLVQHWMNKNGQPVQEEVKQWAAKHWEDDGFRAENLILAHREECTQVLKQAPETMLQTVLATLPTPPRGKSPPAPVQPAPVIQALDQVEHLLGLPEECRNQAPARGSALVEIGVIEKALQETGEKVAALFQGKLDELVVRLFEEPPYRLAGAEEAVRQFSTLVQNALECQETLLAELQQRTVGLYTRLHGLLEGAAPVTSTTPRWKTPFTRRPSDTAPSLDVPELVRSYSKCRYQCLVLKNVNALYVRLRGSLSDQMREIGFCRHRLSELADLIKDSPLGKPETLAGDQVVLPPQCSSFEDAVAQLEADISRDDLLSFDQNVQALIEKQFRALVHVCMASSSVVRTLAPLLLEEAEAFLQPQLDGTSVVDLFLDRYPNDAEGQELLKADLQSAFDEAVPDLACGDAERESCIVTVPAGAGSERLRAVIEELFPHARISVSGRSDEILIYRGSEQVDLSSLEQLGARAQEAYRQRNAQDPTMLHTRNDISEWRPVVAVPY